MHTKPEYLTEQLRDRIAVASPESRKCRVIKALVCTNDAERNVIDQTLFDPSRRSFTHAVAIDQDREHKGRVISSTATAVCAVLGIEGSEIELGHHVENEERQMVRGKPVRHRRWQQEKLVTIGFSQVDRHDQFSRAPLKQGWILRVHATASD